MSRVASLYSHRALGALFATTALATTLAAGAAQAATAGAADTAEASSVNELIVTAQKREENLQDVPISVVSLSTRKLEELHVNSFNDYAKFLPSVSFTSAAPGFANVYMRGIASGENANHSGPLPSVGVYLDEQPITTIGGTLDVRIYDIARVEALAGPQGTLYGASSESGTLRIITNKPRLGVTEGGYDLEVNKVDHGSTGYIGQGYANIPLGEKAAIRLVAWGEHDAGYIDNIPGTRTYGVSGATISNTVTGTAENDYNDVDLYGARAALKIDLNDSWTVTPSVMAQHQETHGIFASDSTVGDLQVIHFFPESATDRWYQAALTVEGKVADFDITYAGAYMNRQQEVHQDYSDYSFFYDAAYGAYVYDNGGNYIDPSQFITGFDRFTKQSHELRFNSPADRPLRVVAGLFYQRQSHHIQQRYQVRNLNDGLEVPGWPDTIWLTQQFRVDRDYAAYGEVTYDFTPQLTGTAGLRYYKYDNSLEGFFGFGAGFSGSTGVAACFAPAQVPGSPCTNLDKETKDTGAIYRFNLSYKIDDDHMIYGTISRGYRPGGINRKGTLPPYKADFLTNYEGGWKTSWGGGVLRWNGAVFYEQWKNFQFSFLGANGLTEIKNAAQARVWGIESDLNWRPTDQFTLSAAGSYIDTALTQPYCGTTDASGNPITNCATPQAPTGQHLPITGAFKANATARYVFDLAEDFRAHLQGSVVYNSSVWADLRAAERALLGQQPSYVTVDLSTGVEHANWHLDLVLVNAFDERAQTYRYAECAILVCGPETYVVPVRPRTFALRFGQKF